MLGVTVLSGKGGTGKTLVAINLALELVRRGEKVALLDADVSNPNLATLMGIDAGSVEPKFTRDHRVVPLSLPEVPEFQVFSIEFIARDRGVGKAGAEYARLVDEVIRHGAWDAKYMVVDAPAGYYDTHKEIVRAFDRDYLGTLVVAQPAHLKDARRVLDIHRVNGIPVLGIIENMAWFQCDSHKEPKRYYIFGEPKAEELASEFGVEYFGQIPLSMKIREGVEKGTPLIPDELSEPIKKAADAVLRAKPRRAGFLSELKEAVSEAVRKKLVATVAKLLLLLNKSVPIRDLQRQYNFPGGRVIRLNLLAKDMSTPVATFDFIVKDGKLKLFKKLADRPDVQIDAYYRAVAWAVLRKKTTELGPVDYDFWTAVWNDEIRVYGEKGWEQMRAWYFLMHCLEEARRRVPDELYRLLEVIA